MGSRKILNGPYKNKIDKEFLTIINLFYVELKHKSKALM